MKKTLAVALLLSVSASAFAVDGGAVLCGILGGATGAAVGQSVGGRNGAILGAAIGGGTGAAIGSSQYQVSNRGDGGYRESRVYRDERGEGYREDHRHRGEGYREERGYRGDGERGYRGEGEDRGSRGGERD